jgi:hypothetical protein
MKTISLLCLMLLCFGLACQKVVGQDKPSDKENLIKVVRFLEEKPFDENAKKYREWAFLYVVETKDVSVTVCTDGIKPVMDKKNKYSGELLLHYSIAMAAFKLENPSKANDENAAQLAGVESMLKAYEAIVKEKPKAQFSGLDALVEKRNKNELAALLVANNCKK